MITGIGRGSAYNVFGNNPCLQGHFTTKEGEDRHIMSRPLCGVYSSGYTVHNWNATSQGIPSNLVNIVGDGAMLTGIARAIVYTINFGKDIIVKYFTEFWFYLA